MDKMVLKKLKDNLHIYQTTINEIVEVQQWRSTHVITLKYRQDICDKYQTTINALVQFYAIIRT